MTWLHQLMRIFSIHFILISFPIIFFLVVQHFLIFYNKEMDGTYTQKKKNRAAIPEFHYFTVINTWLQTLVTQSVSSEEKEKKKKKKH